MTAHELESSVRRCHCVVRDLTTKAMAVSGSWLACACFLVAMSKTQVKEVLGDCNDAHSTILESVLPSPHANEVIKSALSRTMWKSRNPNNPAQTMYLRNIPVQGIMTKDQLSTNFPSATSVLGPACYMQMQIYGRDLSNPLSPAVAATYAHIATHLYQSYSHLVITRAWSAKPATPTNHYIHKGGKGVGPVGLQELDGITAWPRPALPAKLLFAKTTSTSTKYVWRFGGGGTH
eukprot:jgi/Botrbrau1/23612/Bobra.55_2s0007.1